MNIQKVGNTLCVSIYCGLRGAPNTDTRVTTLNWLERWLHITAKQKVMRAITKQQIRGDKLNIKENECDNLLSIGNEILNRGDK